MKFVRWLKKELSEIIPVTLFFFVGFGLVVNVRPRMTVLCADGSSPRR